MKGLGIPYSITKGMLKVARSRGQWSWARRFFSSATKFSSWSWEEMRGLQERDKVIVIDGGRGNHTYDIYSIKES